MGIFKKPTLDSQTPQKNHQSHMANHLVKWLLVNNLHASPPVNSQWAPYNVLRWCAFGQPVAMAQTKRWRESERKKNFSDQSDLGWSGVKKKKKSYYFLLWVMVWLGEKNQRVRGRPTEAVSSSNLLCSKNHPRRQMVWYETRRRETHKCPQKGHAGSRGLLPLTPGCRRQAHGWDQRRQRLSQKQWFHCDLDSTRIKSI